jgi:hypothetical protein
MPSLDACAAGEAGLLRGHGVRIAHPTTAYDVWVAGLGGFTLRHKQAWLRLDGGVPIVRTEYVISGVGSANRPAPVVGRVSIGLAWDVL